MHVKTTRKETLQRLQQILVKRGNALRKALQGDLSLLADFEKQTTGELADFALDSAQFEMSSQLIDFQSKELIQIDAALEKMHKGRYGVCESCDCTIGLPRLIALPYTTFCIECAEEAESSASRSSRSSRDSSHSSDDEEDAVDFEMFSS